MNVSSILKHKGTHVESGGVHLTAGEAAQRLAAGGIGSLLVLDEQADLLGVLSERDLVRALAKYGPDAAGMPIGELIDTHPAICRPADSLRKVMQTMTRR